MRRFGKDGFKSLMLEAFFEVKYFCVACPSHFGVLAMPAIQTLKRCFMFYIAVISSACYAEDVRIGMLPNTLCTDYNSSVYLETRGDVTQSYCVLAFEEPVPFGDSYEKNAIVSVNGRIVKLHRTNEGMNDRYTLQSEDQRFRVVMKVSLAGTSCVEGEDKCCGDDYAGYLVVQGPKNRASVRVSYYRGG